MAVLRSLSKRQQICAKHGFRRPYEVSYHRNQDRLEQMLAGSVHGKGSMAVPALDEVIMAVCTSVLEIGVLRCDTRVCQHELNWTGRTPYT